MRVRIRLETMNDIEKFCNVVSRVGEDVSLQDDYGHCITAKSVLSCAYSNAMWNKTYCVCEKDISAKIFPWLVLHD